MVPPSQLSVQQAITTPRHVVCDTCAHAHFLSYQIVQSVSWNLDVTFPAPFSYMIDALGFFSFDFLR